MSFSVSVGDGASILGDGASIPGDRASILGDRASILVEDGRVFLGHGGKVTCLWAPDGPFVWTDAFKGKGSSGVAIGVPGNVAQDDVDR